MIPRDPTDERLRERTTASFMASLVVHALVALFFFSVLAPSSQQSASESLEGAPSLTVSHVQVKRRVKTAPPPVHHQQPNAPRTGPPKARPVLAGHPPIPQHHVLAKQNPKAPPNPTPVPRAPASPNPQPTQASIAMPSAAPIAQVPHPVPTAPLIALKQTLVTPQPTAAPATPAPSPKPTAAPQQPATAKPAPATPAPTSAPTHAPTAAPRAAVATAAPASPKPSAAPGVASPAPTGAPSPSAQRGTAPSPGPKALAPAGAVPVKAKPAPARPIQLPPTPTPPPPTPRPKPSPVKTASPKAQQQANDLRSRLLAGLPKAPVNPTQAHYNGTANIAKPGDPTPPPEVLARTKFIYENRGVAKAFKIFGGSEQRIKMYVTDVKKHGAFSTCTGWLVRYPQGGSTPAFGSIGADGKLNAGYPGRGGANTYQPVIEEHVTFECETARLEPFVPPAAPSPGP